MVICGEADTAKTTRVTGVDCDDGGSRQGALGFPRWSRIALEEESVEVRPYDKHRQTQTLLILPMYTGVARICSLGQSAANKLLPFTQELGLGEA